MGHVHDMEREMNLEETKIANGAESEFKTRGSYIARK